jgi:hypothetical protein
MIIRDADVSFYGRASVVGIVPGNVVALDTSVNFGDTPSLRLWTSADAPSLAIGVALDFSFSIGDSMRVGARPGAIYPVLAVAGTYGPGGALALTSLAAGSVAPNTASNSMVLAWTLTSGTFASATTLAAIWGGTGIGALGTTLTTLEFYVGNSSEVQLGSLFFQPTTNLGNTLGQSGTNIWDGAFVRKFYDRQVGATGIAVNTSGAGVGGTATLLAGSTDAKGCIEVVTAGVPTANAQICQVNFNNAWASIPFVSLVPANQSAAGLGALSMVYAQHALTTTGKFEVFSNLTALPGGTTYRWVYEVLG